jgi:hypothetical protein
MTGAHESLSCDDLLKLLDVCAKNWLAHDGCWFLAIEEALGTQQAIEFDIRAWERFAPVEAARIKRTFDLPAGPDQGDVLRLGVYPQGREQPG